MNRSELKYWVGVSGFVGLGIKRFRLLKDYFGSVREIWKASLNTLVKVGVNAKMAEEWIGWRNQKDLDKEIVELEKRLIKVITIEDKYYPKLLKETDFPPILLYIKGNIDCLNQKGIAVIGSRKMTMYGKNAVEKLVPGLIKEKLVIVSGLARGVDSWSHRVCLKNKGITIGVLGHGLDKIYPSENKRLAEDIVKNNGALITEYPLKYPIKRGNFKARNRIVAGLSLGVLVIEGKSKSGTKITAGFAGDYGRDVFAVSGPIENPQSQGPADLIQDGAKLVRKVEDILEEL